MPVPLGTGAPPPSLVPNDELPLTVEWLLEGRLLREHHVVRGHERLDVPVSWCRPLADVLRDGAPLQGVVVVGDVDEATSHALAEVARRGAAALFLQVGGPAEPVARWTGVQLPEGLAVVAISQSVRADEIARHVARLSLAYESHALQHARTVHTALAALLHRAAGVDALTTLLAKLSGCPVAVLDPALKLRSYASWQSGLDANSVGAMCSELLHALTQSDTDDDSGPYRHGHVAPRVLRSSINDRPVTCVVGAIALADQQEGWIVVVDPTASPREHDLAEHRVLVEQAGTIIGTELMRVRSIERAEERARGNFVHALLHGSFSNQSDLVARAAHHDFPVDARFGVVVAQARGLIAEDDSPTRLGHMANEALRIQQTSEQRTMVTVVGDVIAAVRQVAPAARSGPDHGARELAAYAQALTRRLQGQTDRSVLVSYGRAVEGARAIGRSYREARIGLALSAQLRLPAPTSYTDLRVPSTLLVLAQDRVGRDFASELLEPLRRAPGDLEAAVRTYVEAGGNLNQAARDLSVHRNTMLYKLERVSKAINWDIREPEAQFAVWLALKLDLLARTADAVSDDA